MFHLFSLVERAALSLNRVLEQVNVCCAVEAVRSALSFKTVVCGCRKEVMSKWA
jgi:hypothetical protein